jgi:hypothetical protein
MLIFWKLFTYLGMHMHIKFRNARKISLSCWKQAIEKSLQCVCTGREKLSLHDVCVRGDLVHRYTKPGSLV